jgi:hypothetical protein
MAENYEAIEPNPDLAQLRPLDLHYFRIPRQRWELMLVRLRQMGADAVSTVVPWAWHQPREGLVDLVGASHSGRGLTRFLDLCASLDMPLFLRVGPYLGVGLLGGGVPAWLLHQHPEIRALAPDLEPLRDPDSGSPMPCSQHPTYLSYVENWFREMSQALVRAQHPAGPIIAVQVNGSLTQDRQTAPEAFGSGWDYNPHVIRVLWPIWLRRQYDGVDGLNAVWGTSYQSVNEAAFPTRPPTANDSPRRYDDAARFADHVATHTETTYTNMLRGNGWTVPVFTASDDLSRPQSISVAHASQVDADPPELGVQVRWAMDAPVQADGTPRRRFWTVKTTLWEMGDGVKPVKGATLVTGADSRAVRLPRPKGECVVHRLLLDGRLVDAPRRTRKDTLYLDYRASDEQGQTDLYVVHRKTTAPLTGLLRDYLRFLLLGKASSLRRTSAMCQTAAAALTVMTPPTVAEPPPTTEDLRAAQRSLTEAHLVAQRTAASLSRLEQLIDTARGKALDSVPEMFDTTAFTTSQMDRLIPIREACGQAALFLGQTAETVAEVCQPTESSLTTSTYQAAWDQADAATRDVTDTLAGPLSTLRTDLAAGALPSAAWPVQDWLTDILQNLATW